jgi:hypothetical protein
MRCPRCSGTLRTIDPGYTMLDVTEGYGEAASQAIGCMMCGYYTEQEIVPKVLIELEDCTIYGTNKYPVTRKPLKDPGWLQNLIIKYNVIIEEYRVTGLSWAKIISMLEKRDTGFKNLHPKSISNVYRKMIRKGLVHA